MTKNYSLSLSPSQRMKPDVDPTIQVRIGQYSKSDFEKILLGKQMDKSENKVRSRNVS
jgi:hypothetical protein